MLWWLEKRVKVLLGIKNKMVNPIEEIIKNLSEAGKKELSSKALMSFKGQAVDILLNIRRYMSLGCPELTDKDKAVVDSLKNQYSDAKEDLERYGVPTNSFETVYQDLISGNHLEAEVIVGLLFNE